MLDKASCREWAAKIKADPSGFTAHKLGFRHTEPAADSGRDLGNRVLSTKELIEIAQGYENCREAIGWDHDLMVPLPLGVRLAHCDSTSRSGCAH